MPTEEDLQQQRDIGKAFREISDLRGEIRTLSAALIGIDGSNGIRGEMRSFISDSKEQTSKFEKLIEDIYSWQAKTEQRFQHYIEHEREATCIGVRALEEYKADQEKEHHESVERRRQNDQLTVELKKAELSVRTAIRTSVISSATAIIVAVLALLPTVLHR
jgi:hypothetical protein